jgi:hypothetical protein
MIEIKIQLTDLEREVFATLPDIDEESYVDDLIALFENATEPVHPALIQIVAHRVGFFLDDGNEPDGEEFTGEKSERIVNAASTVLEAGTSAKDDLLAGIMKLQYRWFWGDMEPAVNDVIALRELIALIEDAPNSEYVGEFVFHNILEPWQDHLSSNPRFGDKDDADYETEWATEIQKFAHL